MPLEQRALLSKRPHESEVIQGDGAERLGQELRSGPYSRQVPFEIDRLGPDHDLERCGLRVEELGATGEQLFLGGVVGVCQRHLGADHIQQGHSVGRRARPKTGDASLEGNQVEASLHGAGGHERRLHQVRRAVTGCDSG
jgi:hypothetical protein